MSRMHYPFSPPLPSPNYVGRTYTLVKRTSFGSSYPYSYDLQLNYFHLQNPSTLVQSSEIANPDIYWWNSVRLLDIFSYIHN
jgi:hypothetical protein